MKKLWFICTVGTLMALISCKDDETTAPLQAVFTSSTQSTVAGEKVTYFDESTGDPVRWDWEFEGGTPATSQLSSPDVVYNAPGTFKVKLTIGRGEQDVVLEKTSFITVAYPGTVVADFKHDIVSETTPPTAYEDDFIQFTDMSAGVPNSWQWTFTPESGTPVTSAVQNPRLKFAAGVYSVTLTVSNPNATASTKTVASFFKVIDPNDVSADFTSVCPRTYAGGPGVSFADASLGNAQSWEWTFEGGTPASSTVQNPTGITYAAAGRYKVTLKASNPNRNSTATKEGFVIVTPATGILLYLPLYSNARDISTNNITPEIVTQGGGTIIYEKDSWQTGGSSARFITTDGNASAANPVGGFLSIPSSASSVFSGCSSGSFTISLWSKTANTAAIMHMFHMGIGITGTATSNQSQIWFRYDTNASYYVRLALAIQGLSGNWTDYKTRMTDGRWHHFIAVRERTSANREITYIYLDGAEVVKVDNAVAKDILTMPYTIGASHVLTATAPFALDKYQQWLIGNVSDYIHWNRALTATEAQALYQLYVPPVTP